MHLFDTDLKQIEPRLVAHYTQAPKLLDAFSKGLDTHGLMADDIFGPGHTLSELSPALALERFIGKSSWLATVYGCSYKKLLYICQNFSEEEINLPLDPYLACLGRLDVKEQAKIRREYGEEADKVYAQWMFFKNVQDQFWKKNPEILAWRSRHIERTRRIGYIVTLGGRRISIDGLDSRDFGTRASAERHAVNYLIQGSSADILKLIMIRAKREIMDAGKGRIFAVVHDELLGELKDQENIKLVKDIMENTVQLRNVRVEADTHLIKSWAEKK